MKYNGNSLKWKISMIELSTNGSITSIRTKCCINTFFKIVIFLVLCYTGLFGIGAVSFGYDLATIVTIIFCIIWISTYTKLLKQQRNLLRKIAQITIDYFSKNKYL